MASLRSRSAGPTRNRTTAPPSSIRQISTPSTEDEKRELSNVCFNEGDLVTFIFTHRNIGWYLGGAAGVHLGMEVVLKPGTEDPQTITVGFYPKEKGGGMVNPVEGALFIPDPAVSDSLAGKIAYTQLNAEPFELSASAASKLNNYTCTKEPGKKIEWSMKKEGNEKDDDGGGGASKTSNVSFQRVVTSPDFSYKFHNLFGRTCTNTTNCQGFITRIFASDLEILKVIVPYLHARGSPEVAALQARMQAEAEEERRRAQWHLSADGKTNLTPASAGIVRGMGMGGNKKKRRKTRRRKRKRKRRRKTRRRRRKKTKKKKKTYMNSRRV
jgi:hypothetical protein